MGLKKVLGAKLVQNLITCLKMACAGASSLRLRVTHVVVVILEPLRNVTIKENLNSATRVSSSLLTRLKTVILQEDAPPPRSMGWRCFGWIPINARPHRERGERSRRRAVNHTSLPCPCAYRPPSSLCGGVALLHCF